MPKKQGNHQAKLHWAVTPWVVNGQCGWKQQPVILVEGREPFYTDSPHDYIAKLEELHDDPTVEHGQFYTLIGQLKDALELAWDVKETILWQEKH